MWHALGFQLHECSQKSKKAPCKQEMKTYKGRFLFLCLSPWVGISSGWKYIKHPNRKNKTRNTKTESKSTHTPAPLIFVQEMKNSVVVVLLLSDTQSFFPVSLPKYIWEKIAAVFLPSAKQQKKSLYCRYEVFRFHFECICKAPFCTDALLKVPNTRALTTENG